MKARPESPRKRPDDPLDRFRWKAGDIRITYAPSRRTLVRPFPNPEAHPMDGDAEGVGFRAADL